MTIKLKVSEVCFNELAAAAEKVGLKINVGSITIDKDTTIVDPIDYRLATIRRDCINEAAKVWRYGENDDTFIEFADKVYQFVLRGKQAKLETPIEQPTTTDKPTGW